MPATSGGSWIVRGTNSQGAPSDPIVRLSVISSWTLVDVDYRLQYIDRDFRRTTLTDQKQVIGAKFLYLNLMASQWVRQKQLPGPFEKPYLRKPVEK
jgi:hypothetical protein